MTWKPWKLLASLTHYASKLTMHCVNVVIDSPLQLQAEDNATDITAIIMYNKMKKYTVSTLVLLYYYSIISISLSYYIFTTKLFVTIIILSYRKL